MHSGAHFPTLNRSSGAIGACLVSGAIPMDGENTLYEVYKKNYVCLYLSHHDIHIVVVVVVSWCRRFEQGITSNTLVTQSEKNKTKQKTQVRQTLTYDMTGSGRPCVYMPF